MIVSNVEVDREEKRKKQRGKGKHSLWTSWIGKVKALSTSADGFPLVEEIVDVATPLMMQPENWPKGLHLSLSLVRLRFSWDTEENDLG